MKKTITTITYSIGDTPLTRLHFVGEVKKNCLPAFLQRDFNFTNHLGESDEVLAIQSFNIGNVNVDVDVDDVDAGIFLFSTINEFYKTHKMYYMLKGLEKSKPKNVTKIKKIKRVK